MALEVLLLFASGIISLLFFTRSVLSHTHRVQHLPPSPLALPIIGHFHILGPLIHRSFQALSFRFGPIFSLRLGSVPCIVVTSPELAKEFLKTHELSFATHAQSAAIKRITYDSSLAFSPYGPYWKFIKKVTVNELLSSRSVGKFHSIRADGYSRLLRLLAERAESCLAVNLSEELPRLGHNIIGQMMLGKYSTSSSTERAEEARLVVREATRIFGELNLCDFNMVWKKLDLQGFGKRIEDTHLKFDELVEKVVKEREQLRIKNKKTNGGEEKDEEVKDFLSILLDMLEDESGESVEVGFSRVHIKALIMDLFTASTDTTAITMEWALAELINHPAVLEKAREEIDRVVGNERIVEESDGSNLPYIQAIIKETFRLHPPVPMVTRISVEDCKVGEYVIPTNTILFVNNWAIGRDPKNWENPLDFRPERFLEGGDQITEMDVRGQHFQFLPFGSGRRICPGINLTMKMVPSLVAAMIQCFDWKVIPSKKMNNNDCVVEMDERPGLTTPRAHDLVCFPVARINLLNILKP
ncbi:PREDICTED: licodione synthase-like [Fragaria vesca subsp. vesca]|uniref:licodione synthase-like n=1 Tax=Fragaria vesca subsp. vesca TaxID=101020 RepID=UPI0002C357A9|nr:PREDICTED: licodione synthase-like [Fragaria vesca subsp. vesca]